MAQEQPTPAPQKQLLLQKIYVKDLSFESPKAPMVFTTNVAPQTQLNVRSSAQQVAPDTQEVTLTITVEAKDKDSTLFLAEVAQSGIFVIQGLYGRGAVDPDRQLLPEHAVPVRARSDLRARHARADSRRCCCSR